MRVIRSSFVLPWVAAISLPLGLGVGVASGGDGLQVGLQTVEALLPELAVLLDPARCLFERTGLDAAGAPLRVSAAGDEARALEHLQVLGDGRPRQVEGFCQL